MSNVESEGVPGGGFLVMAFNDEKAGDEVLKMMKDAKKKKEFYFEDATVVRQDAKGKVHYHETGDMHTGKGAGAGALIGGLIGILGGPAGVVLGAGAGAAIGAAAAHGDAGFKDEGLDTIGVALKPGSSAVAAITSHAFLKAVQDEIPVAEVHAFVKDLAGEISNRLEQDQDMALGIILTEDGLAVKEVAVGKDSTEVFGIVETDEGVLVGAAVATAAGAAYEFGVATEEGAVVETGVVTPEGEVIVDEVIVDEAEKEEEKDE
jgi:uncharacterized membrane protein